MKPHRHRAHGTLARIDDVDGAAVPIGDEEQPAVGREGGRPRMRTAFPRRGDPAGAVVDERDAIREIAGHGQRRTIRRTRHRRRIEVVAQRYRSVDARRSGVDMHDRVRARTGDPDPVAGGVAERGPEGVAQRDMRERREGSRVDDAQARRSVAGVDDERPATVT